MTKRIRWGWLALVGLLAVLFIWAARLTPERVVPLISARFPQVQWIETQTLAEWIRGDESPMPLLLDARSSEEFAVSHLPGAVHVDPVAPELGAIGFSPNRPIVVYCSVGYRSAAIAEQIERAGVGPVRNLRGGIFAWANEGRPIVHDGAPTDTVHPYNALWGRLLEPERRWSPGE